MGNVCGRELELPPAPPALADATDVASSSDDADCADGMVAIRSQRSCMTFVSAAIAPRFLLSPVIFADSDVFESRRSRSTPPIAVALKTSDAREIS